MHSPNNRHCQCHSCNHPCAHICKTRKPKGKRWTDEMAHMCHFSSKPHAHMCCGGEDLPSAAQPIMEPGISWKHSEVISSLRAVPIEPQSHRRKSATVPDAEMRPSKKSPRKLSPTFNGSAILERTGSDISISSLPSSSSVAEVYIGRSVLTDESDIDSETERSLEQVAVAATTTSNNAKVGNKQGLRSLVACFFANSLRNLKKFDKKEKPLTSGATRSQRNRKRSQQLLSRSEKDKLRHKPAKLGLSSTDASYGDIPSSVANTAPLNSLSSDISHPVCYAQDVNVRPSVLYSSSSSPRYASTSKAMKQSGLKSSPPCRISEFVQRQIDGHISEEVTNSTSSSSAPKATSVERPERPSTNASTENTSSPRRRRLKGPAPKPPIYMTQCSSSPLSTNFVSTSCPSSLPQSPSNSSVVTSSSTASKKNHHHHHHHKVVHSKSPVPLPPNLTRSLSEQKQLNMKNMINAMAEFRSEVNLQEEEKAVIAGQSTITETDENIVLIYEHKSVKQMEEAIYQIPQSLKPVEDAPPPPPLPPPLPVKTFDPYKMFGCEYNTNTKRLEKRKFGPLDPTILNRSQSMPFTEYTCCLFHWNQYLASLNEFTPMFSCENEADFHPCVKKDPLPVRKPNCCDCEDEIKKPEQQQQQQQECDDSDLMNALLSPKHSVRYKKTSTPKSSKKNSSSDINNNENNQAEFLRTMSDGSLTTSTTTVVEFINDDDECKENDGKDQKNVAVDSKETSERRFLSDVFCQANLPEKPPRRYKHYKHSCRCRQMKSRQNRHCRHHCAHHLDQCCPPKSGNIWLTSSTSDHSLSSLSSSTSTLSESSTLRTSTGLDFTTLGPQQQQQFVASISPFGDATIPTDADTGGALYKERNLLDLIAGRSPISAERLFKSAENNFPGESFLFEEKPSGFSPDLFQSKVLNYLHKMLIGLCFFYCSRSKIKWKGLLSTTD